MKQEWCELNEVVESDFLISPGDIYPNRKVELEDADIKEATRISFETLCEQQHGAFSKNNKDMGRTQLIEMEIDTGDSLPVAQSPYTLPLKHYNCICQEIETLEKSGVIERSLLRWASPVIVVPKKSAPDEPLRRRLCVDYQKDIPDLYFHVIDVKEEGDSVKKTEVMEIMDVNREDCVTAPPTSDFREHSRNSLEKAAGETLELVSEQKSIKETLDSELASNTSKYREHSQESRNSRKPTDVEMARKLVKRMLSRHTHPQHS